MPKVIEKNVAFWVAVYGIYPTSTVLIHDKEDLSVIYEIVNLEEYPLPPKQSRQVIIEERKEKYRKALKRLADMQKPVCYDSLTAVERHVYLAWLHETDDEKYGRAYDNIRAQVGVSDRFRDSVVRSGRYLAIIREIFKSYGIPEELAYLAHVESLFNYKSYSKAGAAGIWQFIRHTGRLFLTIDDAVDERLDPVAATEAAAKLLKKSYDELGSWPLAITAYNHGLIGMREAVRLFGNEDFGVVYENYRSRTFGFASKNFYAEFLAALYVAEHAHDFFGPLEPAPEIRFQRVELPVPMSVREAAELFSVPADTLAAYNYAFRPAAVENKVKLPAGYKLKLPYREGFNPLRVFDTFQPNPMGEGQSPNPSSSAGGGAAADETNPSPADAGNSRGIDASKP